MAEAGEAGGGGAVTWGENRRPSCGPRSGASAFAAAPATLGLGAATASGMPTRRWGGVRAWHPALRSTSPT